LMAPSPGSVEWVMAALRYPMLARSHTMQPSPSSMAAWVETSLARGWMMVRAARVMGCVPVRRAVSARVLVGWVWRRGFAGAGLGVGGAGVGFWRG